MDLSTISPLFLPSLQLNTIFNSALENIILPNTSRNVSSKYSVLHPNRSQNISLKYSALHSLVIRCLSWYSLALVIIGTLGNILSIIILCRRNLRRYVTMRYLIAVSVCDIISLYGWNLNNFYKFSISTELNNIEELSIVHCRLFSFLTFVGLQLSSWCLTAVSLDRCLSLCFLTWKQKYGKLARTKYHIAILAITCLLLNCHMLFYNGYYYFDPSKNKNKVKCYATRTNPHYIFPQWERVHLVVYNLCPFIIMLLCNTYIIYVTVRSARIRTTSRLSIPGKRARSNTSRHRQLSLMLMLVTFAFVLLTLPSCLYYVFFRHHMSATKYSKNYRHMVQICLSSVQFTSHAVNFFLYCFSATNFRNELRDFMKELCFHRSTRFNTNKSAITKLSTFTRINQKQIKFNPKTTLEHQPTQLNNGLKDFQTKSINLERTNNPNCDKDSITN